MNKKNLTDYLTESPYLLKNGKITMANQKQAKVKILSINNASGSPALSTNNGREFENDELTSMQCFILCGETEEGNTFLIRNAIINAAKELAAIKSAEKKTGKDAKEDKDDPAFEEAYNDSINQINKYLSLYFETYKKTLEESSDNGTDAEKNAENTALDAMNEEMKNDAEKEAEKITGSDDKNTSVFKEAFSSAHEHIIYTYNLYNRYAADDYVIAIEPFSRCFKTLRGLDLDSLFKQAIEKYDIGVYRLDNNNPNDKRNKKDSNKCCFVLIRIVENRQPETKYLDAYFASSDTRTYNNVTYNMIQYKMVSGDEVPENKPDKLPHNLLVSGAPGTGKSHLIQKLVTESGQKIINNNQQAEEAYWNEFCARVTFYEDYSYENFVGCYKPVPLNDEKITYSYVPGPFTDMYIKACKYPEHCYFLIIEEINRAKAASVFGDIFQLLDRDKKGNSNYTIKPESALNDYLKEQFKQEYDVTMRLPSNLYLLATMNSADQGVMPLDAAFKRRWSQLYMDINSSGSSYCLTLINKNGDPQEIIWDNLRAMINEKILSQGFDEDRCIGRWYFSETEREQINYYTNPDGSNGNPPMTPDQKEEKRANLPNPLVDKLFYYLRQDLFRRNPSVMFKAETGKKNITMSDIRSRVKRGEPIEKILDLSKELEWVEKAPENDTPAPADNQQNNP